MADSKVTGLGELIGPPADNDMIYLADVSDTSMAASGTSKKNQGKNYLRTNGTANTLGAHIAANGYNFTGAGTVTANVVVVPTYYGGTASGGTVTLSSTTNGTKGKILFGAASAYDENSASMGIGTVDPSYKFHVIGSFQCNQAGESWASASYNTGWGDYGGGYSGAKYRKFGDLVMLMGLVVRSSGVATTIFTLPSGYRPVASIMFSQIANDAVARIGVDGSGNVILQAGAATPWVNLTGIVFSTL